jgi:hypothetical protein
MCSKSSQIVVFWYLTPCSLTDLCQYFRRTCCLHLQGFLRLEVPKMETRGSSETLVTIYHNTRSHSWFRRLLVWLVIRVASELSEFMQQIVQIVNQHHTRSTSCTTRNVAQHDCSWVGKLMLHKTFLRNTIDREWAPLDTKEGKGLSEGHGHDLSCIVHFQQRTRHDIHKY